MDTWLSTLPVGQLGAGGLVALAVLALFKGWIVPRSVLDDVRADRDARIAELVRERDSARAELIKERDDWRGAYFDSEKSRSVLVEQVGEFTELARSWLQAVQSVERTDTDGRT